MMLVETRRSLLLNELGTIGVTDYAQQLLGDVVFVELPPVDSFVNKGGTCFLVSKTIINIEY
jgi:glycine cleavage system H lipoate-binding protein